MKIKTIQDLANIKELPDLVRFTAQVCKDIINVVNGGLDFASNFRSSIVSVTFSGASTDVGVSHSLGAVPTGYVVVKSSANINVFDGVSGNTDSTIFLASSGAGTVSVLVF